MASIDDRIKMMQEMVDQNEQDRKIKIMEDVLANSPQEDPSLPSGPSIEEKYIKPLTYPLYDVAHAAGQVLDYASTPFQWLIAPAGKAINQASNAIQGKPQEALISPTEHPYDYAKAYGTSDALMRTLPVGNQSISEMLPETKFGNFMKREFPEASSIPRAITPNQIGSGVLDYGLAKKLPERTSSTYHEALPLETAAEYVRAMAKDDSQLMELEKSGRIYELAKMVQKDPEAYLHPFRPNKIYENIMGDIIPTEARRDWGSGKLNKVMKVQNQFIEDMPRNTYVAPLDEMRLAVHEQLSTHGGDMLPSQRDAAAKFIDAAVSPLRPSQDKVNKIKAVQAAQAKLQELNKQIPSTRMDLENQINQLKAKTIGAVNEMPDVVHNPKYREDLQWLSSLEVLKDADEVVPKNIQVNKTLLNSEFTGHESQIPIHKEITTETQIPRETNYAPKNQQMLDIMQGQAKEPSTIQNPQQTVQLQTSIARLSELNQELKNLSNSPASSVKNKNLLKMMDEKQKLEGFVHENYDPSTPDISSYFDIINERNDMPAGYTSTLRQKGNKLMSRPAIGENPLEVESRQLAGRAMEQVGSNEQAKIMESSTHPQLQNELYYDRNKDVSNMIDMRNLMQGNFVSDNSPLTYLPKSLTGTTGGASLFTRAKGRYTPVVSGPLAEVRNTLGSVNPQAVISHSAAPNIMQRSLIAKPIAEQLADWEIPRSADQILDNKRLTLAKIAQVTNDPMIVNVLNDAFDKHPEKLDTILPALIANPMFHNLFKANKYQSWVSGKILDPMEIQKAYRDVENKKGITNTQKILLQSELNRDGTFPEDF